MQRTDMDCHQCGKQFIAQLDMSLDGNHLIECPYCAHEHCRVVKAGRVTGDRWDSRNENVRATTKRSTWKPDSRPLQTSTAAAFIRDSWLSRLDLNL